MPFAGYPNSRTISTDGRRQVYTDPATGALMIVNLAGTDKRVIFKPKTGEHLGPYAWAGGALILGAAVTLTTRGHEPEPAIILE